MRPNDLPLAYRLLLQTYPWRTVRPVPVAALVKPLDKCRVALITTAGLVVPGDAPFDLRARGGDVSFRVVPGHVDLRTLEQHHRSDAFDRAPIDADRNVAFPLDRLRELAGEGLVGSVALHHVSFMGSITAPGRLRSRTAPDAARLLVGDDVDVALLAPV